MVFFPNEKISLYTYGDTENLDAYGNPKKGYIYQSTIDCDFQPMTPKDSLEEFGKILEDTFKIYIDIDVEIADNTIIKLHRDNSVYNITGTPITNNHLLPVKHKKIVVQKQRKPLALPEPPEEEEIETPNNSVTPSEQDGEEP